MTVGERISKAVARVPGGILDWIGRVPTTQIRVLITCGAIIVTTARYVLEPSQCLGGQCTPGWEPSIEWLGFLATMAGIDTAHFLGKRKTSAEYMAASGGAAKEDK